MQEEMDRVTTELEEKEYKATSGGDAVEAVVTGKMELKTLTVKPEVVDPEDVEMLSDLIIAAANEALRANLFLPCLGVFLLAGYVELVMRAFGRPVRLLPRRPAFYWCALGFFLLYWILRNFPAFDFLRL